MKFPLQEAEQKRYEFAMMREVTISDQVARKIEAHTSTTRLKIIMTIDIQVAIASDLSVENQVMNFRGVDMPAGITLAGASWLVAEVSPPEALMAALQFVLREVRRHWSDFSIWLLVGHSAWQPDTRIVRHHKLWGSLKARGTDIPRAGRLQEVKLESEGRLKYFGAVEFSEFSIESVIPVILKEHCTYIAVVPNGLDVTQIIKRGWSGEISKDFSLLIDISQAGGLLIKKVGQFDDQEWGVLAVGRPSILTDLHD